MIEGESERNAAAMAVMAWQLSTALFQSLDMSEDAALVLVKEVLDSSIGSAPELEPELRKLATMLLEDLDGNQTPTVQ